MNEALIKTIVKYKLDAANKVVDKLPQEVSKELRGLGRIILDSINESASKVEVPSENKTKAASKLNSITIE